MTVEMRRAVAFLTPIGGAAAPTARALAWFPVVGALIGAGVGAVWWGADALWAPPVGAALAVGADLALTGLLHIDGLADTADGLLPPATRERRLDIMRDPRAGGFGVAAVVTLLVIRFATLASMSASARSVLALGAIWATSRLAMAVMATVMPYAREQGLASAFRGGSLAEILAVGIPVVAVLAWFATVPATRGVLAVAATALGAAAVGAFARARIGGFTGDVLGAAAIIGETAGLLVLAVRV